MLNLYVLYEMSFGYSTSFLDVFAMLSILLGIFIIITKNPIISVLYLILLFSSVSCYLIFIGIKFIGISYLLVYVGAVSILFIFILMLINIRISELISDTNNNLPLALITIIAFFIPFTNLLPDTKSKLNVIGFELNKLLQDITNIKQVSYVTSKSWDGNILDSTDIMSIGNIMYTSYSIWLLITSIILLLAMVGSIVITIKQIKKRLWFNRQNMWLLIAII
jgi:NADH-ubiquinone oxidoreductase chain 6